MVKLKRFLTNYTSKLLYACVISYYLICETFGFSFTLQSCPAAGSFHCHSGIPSNNNNKNKYAQVLRSSYRKISLPPIAATADDSVNDESSSRSKDKHEKYEDLTPINVLYPWLEQKDAHRMTLENAIQIMVKAIESLDEFQYRREGNAKVLRITQRLSHLVDPLAWLDSQRLIKTGNRKNDECESSISRGYFANVEGTQEAAFIGSVRTFHHLLANDNIITNPNSTIKYNESKKHDKQWSWIHSNVPFESRIYGASKFDTTSKKSTVNQQNSRSSNPGNEWDAFLPSNDNTITGVWVLPALELRRYHTGNQEEMTLSAHITFQNDSEDKKNGSNTQQIIDILTKLSSSQGESSSKMPTNMPPIVSRSYYPSLDDGPFEHGIEAALKLFDDPTEELQKTVMARRADLHFASEASDIRGIDIVKRLKYSGQHVGHLFYIQSSNDENVEFLSGTPERLFSISPNMLDETDSRTKALDETHQQKQWTVRT